MKPRQLWATLRAALTENLSYKAAAFVAAILLWAWVQSEQVVQERVRVGLDWVLPEGLVLLESPLPSVTATVEGTQAWVRGVRQLDLAMRIDLSGAGEGAVTIDLADRPVTGLPTQVRVVSIAPETLQARLDRTLRRRLPVVAATRGEVAVGYVLKSLAVSPSRVEVTGPASVLRGMTEVQTDEVDLSTLREDGEFQVGLDLRKGQLRAPQGEKFTVSVAVAPVQRERAFEEVPVVVRGDGAWVPRQPLVAVTLVGPGDRLEALDPEAISVLVYVPAATEGAVLEATGKKGDPVRYEVVHAGGDAVSVKGVEPRTLELTRRE